MGWMAPLRHLGAKVLVGQRPPANREPSMGEITTIGFDLAKNVFQIHGIDAEGSTVLRKQLRRAQVLAFFSKLPRCVVGMEACATAHHWARELRALGHEVRLMPAQYVKAYVKRNKTMQRMLKPSAKRFCARRCATCRSRQLINKLLCCCTEGGSGWFASARCWRMLCARISLSSE